MSPLVGAGATVSHVHVTVRALRHRTADVVAAVEAGEAVTLTSRGEPIAEIVPHRRRTRWLPGGWLQEQVANRQADVDLQRELDDAVGATVDEP